MASTRALFGTHEVNPDGSLRENVNAWTNMGLDFDGKCTRSPTCYRNDNPLDVVDDLSCKTDTTPGDGNQCRDNQIGRLFKLAAGSPNIGIVFGMTEPDWNCEIRRGGFGTVFKVSNYNGEKNDPRVRVDIYSSTGVERPIGWPCRRIPPSLTARIDGVLDPEWYKRPAWEKSESNPWQIPSRNIAANAEPIPNELKNSRVYDALAFVRNGYLVAKLPPSSEHALFGKNTVLPGFRMILERGVLLAEIGKRTEDGNWVLKGTLAGVVDPGDMLNSFREIGVCENMCGSYGSIRDYFNNARDTLRTDTAQPDVNCEMLSFAELIEAQEATVNKTPVDNLPLTGPLNGECPVPAHPEGSRPCDGGT
jgi:hypothetical protein